MDSRHVEMVNTSNFEERIVNVLADGGASLTRHRPPVDAFLVSYPYGQLILDRGQFHTPCDNEYRVEPCEGCRQLRESVRDKIPLTLVVENQVEVFVEDEQHSRSIPLRMISPGEWFGVFEALDRLIGAEWSPSSWSVSSGARSVVLLAPFKNQKLIEAVRTSTGSVGNGIAWKKIDPQKDAWPLIREIGSRTTWNSRVLVFPTGFPNPAAHPELLSTLYRLGWVQSLPLRRAQEFEAERELRVAALEVGPSGNRFLTYATLLHLLASARGHIPAFVPVESISVPAGPFKEVAARLADTQAPWRRFLKHYPVLLQPAHLRSGDVGYYSFHRPTVLHSSPKPKGSIAQFLEGCILRTLDPFAAKQPDSPNGVTLKTGLLDGLRPAQLAFYRARQPKESHDLRPKPKVFLRSSIHERYHFSDSLAPTTFMPECDLDFPQNSDWFTAVAQVVGS